MNAGSTDDAERRQADASDGTADPRGTDAELLARVRSLYHAGRLHAAHEAARALGPYERWPTTSGRLLAGRLITHLGAARRGGVLIALAYRRDRADQEARYFEGLRILDARGPFAAWRHLSRCGEPPEETAPEHRADWYALHGRVLATVRDFEEAEAWQRRAEATAAAHPWVWVEAAELLERQDRLEEAIAAVRHALTLNPFDRPAVQLAARQLASVGRDDEALSLLVAACKRMESGFIWVQRAQLESERGRHADALASFERAIELLPLMEKPYASWFFARRSDEAYALGDQADAVAWARESDVPALRRFADALAARHEPVRRVLLPVGFVRQHHVTCAPATLASISAYWSRPADHLEVAERICYDGTPAHSERRWAEENGFAVREFTVTWDVTRALLDRGVPFTLTTVGPRAGHLQAALGYDDCRMSLLVRDPGSPLIAEYTIEGLLAAHRATGPRGMALVPADQAGLVAEVDLPDAALYDLFHRLQSGLARHDRATAWEAWQELAERAPDHRLALIGRRSIAAYDHDISTLLDCVERLLARFPEDVNLQLEQLSCLGQLARRDLRRKILAERAADGGDPIFLGIYARELSVDARRHPEANRLFLRTLRTRRDDAAAHHGLAANLWDAGAQAEALLLYRWAACLEATDEGAAWSYFAACRHLGRTATGLKFLEDRFRRFGRLSGWPGRTLSRALSELDREPEAFAVLDEAVRLRPDDGDLLLHAADFHWRYNRPERAEELLAAAGERCHPAELLRTRARLATYRGEHARALELWQQIVASDPLGVDAHATVATLIADRDGPPAAIACLRSAVERFPHHYALNQLLIERLRTSDPREAEETVRRLLESHPDDAWAHRELALVLGRQDRADEGLTAAQTAFAIEPATPASHVVRARIRQLLGRTAEAREDYRSAIRLSADEVSAIDGLMQSCGDDDERRADLDFIRRELARQTTFGDGLISFREHAAGLLDAAALEQVLRDALAARPDLAQAWSTLAMQLAATGRHDEARALAEEATRKFPLLPRVWYDLAMVLAAANDPAAEIAALERALAINPAWGTVSRRLAEIHERAGDLPRSRAVLEQAVARDPGDGISFGCLADACWNQGHRDAAVAHLTRALRLVPSYTWGWETLDRWLQMLGREDEILQLAAEITADRPGDFRAWFAAATLLAARSRYAEALDRLDRVIGINPLFVEAHDLRADCLARENRLDEALAATAPEAWPGRAPPELRARAADIIARRGDVAGAIALLQEVVAEVPAYPWAWMRLAEWHTTLGADVESLRAAEQFATHAPGSAVAFGYLGDAERRCGDPRRALEAFEKAHELDPAYLFGGFALVDTLLRHDRRRVRAVLDRLHAAAPLPGVFEKEVHVGIALRDGTLVERGLSALCAAAEDDGDCLPRAAKAIAWSRWRFRGRALVRRALAAPTGNPNLGVARLRFNLIPGTGIRWLGTLHPATERWRRACGELLDQLAARGEFGGSGMDRLRKLHGPALRADDRIWAEYGRTLYQVGRYRHCTEWLADWRSRGNLEPWMLANLVLAHWACDDVAAAETTARAALDLPPDHSADLHALLLAACEMATGDPAAAARRLEPIEAARLGHFQGVLHRLLGHAAPLLTEPDGGGGWARSSRLRQRLASDWNVVSGNAVCNAIYRRIVRRLAERHGNRLLAAWVTPGMKGLYPLPPGYAAEGPSLEDLRPTYRRWDRGKLPLGLVLATAATFAWAMLLMHLQRWQTARFEPTVFHFHPPPVAMIVPAILLGIMSSYPLGALVYRALLGRRWRLFARYRNLKHGFDERRARRTTFVCLAFMCTAMIAALANWRAAFGPEEVRFQSWLGFARSSYPYAAVADIRTSRQFRAPNGKLVQRREWILEFIDGARWKTSFDIFGLTESQKASVAAFVSEKSGKPVREVTVLE
jgi:tetratricopeptide (TPR) repeat protein